MAVREENQDSRLPEQTLDDAMFSFIEVITVFRVKRALAIWEIGLQEAMQLAREKSVWRELVRA